MLVADEVSWYDLWATAEVGANDVCETEAGATVAFDTVASAFGETAAWLGYEPHDPEVKHSDDSADSATDLDSFVLAVE